MRLCCAETVMEIKDINSNKCIAIYYETLGCIWKMHGI